MSEEDSPFLLCINSLKLTPMHLSYSVFSATLRLNKILFNRRGTEETEETEEIKDSRSHLERGSYKSFLGLSMPILSQLILYLKVSRYANTESTSWTINTINFLVLNISDIIHKNIER